MSNTDFPAQGGPSAGQGTAGGTDIVTQLQGIIRQLSNANTNMLALIAAIQGVFPRIIGSFTLAASATTVIPQSAVTANSEIPLTPTNAAAATLMGSAKAIYVSAKTPGVSFTVGG